MFLVFANILELIAAISGTYYLSKKPDIPFIKYFVCFLWLTVFVEVIFGWLPWFIYYKDSFSALKDTFLAKNHWCYNSYFIISFYVYITLFRRNLENLKHRKILRFLEIIFIVSSIFNLVLTNVFFETISSYTYIGGTCLIFLSASFYFYGLLISDKILNFRRSILFYIGVGTVLFHLSATPLFIYSGFYLHGKSLGFVIIREYILNSAIVFLYTCYTIGFIICAKKNSY